MAIKETAKTISNVTGKRPTSFDVVEERIVATIELSYDSLGEPPVEAAFRSIARRVEQVSHENNHSPVEVSFRFQLNETLFSTVVKVGDA